ncbi:hypothetical protein NC653_041039 [Populus alba x Populus x berolinensis]|uniref:Uncharacterized protein n=1 Tax=Populus alba x Populus x berolinensis TaxID=444605 RepID=A0AAD6L918_9ROSI|nr:hypothetical protein NC653_041039 [Populus alba x Populus x berolinensis]
MGKNHYSGEQSSIQGNVHFKSGKPLVSGSLLD